MPPKDTEVKPSGAVTVRLPSPCCASALASGAVPPLRLASPTISVSVVVLGSPGFTLILLLIFTVISEMAESPSLSVYCTEKDPASALPSVPVMVYSPVLGLSVTVPHAKLPSTGLPFSSTKE